MSATRVASGAHLPLLIEHEGAIARSKQRVQFLLGEELPPLLREAGGSCVHMKRACFGRPGDDELLDLLVTDIEAAGYREAGDALGMHRSKKHLQIWGEALIASDAFTLLVTRVLDLFDLSLVDCWCNLYRNGDDGKSWHHDNYQDRTPRPTVTIGVSLGQARELAFQHAVTRKEVRVLQESGDIFAFDEPFNNVFRHGVPAAPHWQAPGRRLSVILWANEQECVPQILRVKNPGVRDIVPLEVDWRTWDTRAHGDIFREARRLRREQRTRSDPCGQGHITPESTAAVQESACRSGSRLADAESHDRGEKQPRYEDSDMPRLLDLFVHLACPKVHQRPDGEGRHKTAVDEPSVWKAVGHSFYPTYTSGCGGQVPAKVSNLTTNTCEAGPCIEEHQIQNEYKFKDQPAIPLTLTIAREVDLGTTAVTKALTLQGGQQVLGVLRGYKLIENRAWKIPIGWYAIHSGSQTISEERAERIRLVWPDAPLEASLPHGAIMGLFYVHSQRTPEECRPGYVWARGPICHLVSKAIEFQKSIPCSGGKGLWPLQAWQLARIRAELQIAPVMHFDLKEATG